MSRTAIESKQIAYTIRQSSRARKLRLTVHHDGRVVVTIPRGVSVGAAERFVRKKAQWLFAKVAFFKKYYASSVNRLTSRDYVKHKESARVLVHDRLGHFNKFYKLTWGRISIRDQKTRWGSCSKNGNLNFNYKIAMLPLDLADYIVVHELCHLQEFNHSPGFWALVAKTIPEHRERRRRLRQKGMNLNI